MNRSQIFRLAHQKAAKLKRNPDVFAPWAKGKTYREIFAEVLKAEYERAK